MPRVKAVPPPHWLVTPRINNGASELQLHAVRGGVTLCGLTTRTCAWFRPATNGHHTPCQECVTALNPPQKKRHKRPPGHATSTELLEAAGITYRQLDHWVTSGLITPAHGSNPGGGMCRYFTPTDVRAATIMGALVTAGLSPQAAARAAHNSGWLAPGVRIVLDEETDEDRLTWSRVRR